MGKEGKRIFRVEIAEVEIKIKDDGEVKVEASKDLDTHNIYCGTEKIPSRSEFSPLSFLRQIIHDLDQRGALHGEVRTSYIYIRINSSHYVLIYDVFRRQDKVVSPGLFQVSDEKFFEEIKKYIGEIKKYIGEIQHLEAYIKESGMVELSISIKKVDTRGNDVILVCDIVSDIFRYPWGESLKIMSIPPLPKPGELPGHALLLGGPPCNTSSNSASGSAFESIKHNFYEINAIVRDHSRTIFIHGEPGSGKEVYARAIHFSSQNRSLTKEGSGYIVRSVAGMKREELRELLFGRVVQQTTIPGLIKNAEMEGGTLFLDEFDKIKDAEFYSELLRVLEAGEYIPVNGANTEKVGKISWIFAGAFTGGEASRTLADLPDDFWSRLTAHISIKNPIKEDKFYIYWLFMYFFIRNVVKIAGSACDVLDENNNGYKYALARSILGLNAGRSGLFEPGEFVKGLSEQFANNISYGKYKIGKYKIPCRGEEAYDSVRSVRQAANAAFVVVRDYLMTNVKKFDVDVYVMENKKKEEIIKKALNRAVGIVKMMRKGK